MLMSVRIERFSASYELSAIVLPCDASRNAAIQSAYCFSCNHNNLSVYVVGGEGECTRTFSVLIQCSTKSLLEGTSSLMLYLDEEMLTSGVTSQPATATCCTGGTETVTAVTSLTFEVDAQQGRVVRFLSTPEERQVRVFEDEEETLVTLQCELLGSERAHYDFNADILKRLHACSYLSIYDAILRKCNLIFNLIQCLLLV